MRLLIFFEWLCEAITIRELTEKAVTRDPPREPPPAPPTPLALVMRIK